MTAESLWILIHHECRYEIRVMVPVRSAAGAVAWYREYDQCALCGAQADMHR